ncbi:MAG: hypothetical protein ABR593_05370 [Candidatus Limnocylindria bacterium]
MTTGAANGLLDEPEGRGRADEVVDVGAAAAMAAPETPTAGSKNAAWMGQPFYP